MLVGLAAALLAAVPAIADPSRVEQKRAEAQSVMAQIQAMDSRLGRAIESYNLANVKLQRIRTDIRRNAFELELAKTNLRVGQGRIAKRVVELYTSAGSGGAMEVILGAQSLDDLLNRLETVDRVTSLDAEVVKQVRTFRESTKQHAVALARARVAQERVVGQRAAEKQSIEAQLAQRRSLLASIKDEIGKLEAAERAREARMAQQARERLAAMQAVQQVATDPSALADVATDATTTDAATTDPSSSDPAPPPSQYSGVVGVAMRYLGVRYVWGGASPSGFDCSGLVSYAFAQLGVSVPHSTYAIWGMGTAVPRDQLQPGDLVFFDGLGHMGIYIGGGQFVHAPHTGDVVKVSSLGESWYASTYVGARRL